MDTPVISPFSPALEALRAAAKRPPIGAWLMEEGYVTEETVDAALILQEEQGGRYGEILTHYGYVTPLTLHRALARQHGLPFVDLMKEPPDAALFASKHLEAYHRLSAVPYRREGAQLWVATSEPERLLAATDSPFAGEDIRLLVTSPRDIAWTLQRIFQPYYSAEASEHLGRTHPHYALQPHIRTSRISARMQGVGLGALMTLAVALWPVQAVTTLLVLACAFFLSTLVFKLVLLKVGLKVQPRVYALGETDLPDYADCPVYTVLVPLYREAESVLGLMESLSALDYPADRLDIKLIVEASDTPTRAAIMAAKPDARFDIIVVPRSHPQTKPKACNYALRFAKGEFLTIYDAEDAPDVTQLRRAVAIFRSHPHIACLQARLNYYNAEENTLTRLFSLEYAMLFDVMLPALYALKIPIPLGGTSNHMRCGVLHRLGAWDAYNVTEDADLGVRLASEGYVTLPFNALTQEEAPVHVSAWIVQRSRWIKGYFQTWGVLAREPKMKQLRLGHRGFWGVHFFIGAASLSYALAPLLWTGAGLWVLLAPAWMMPAWIGWLCLATCGAGMALQWASAGILAWRHERHFALTTLLLYPFYFILHQLASARALWQLLRSPYQWDKTTHGVTRMRRASAKIRK
jgi:cellulose synthase/poly-beta-1,6-N-acetylglucosamine synthase-like glycosyltransferase